MLPKFQEVQAEPGLQFDRIIQDSLSKLEPESAQRGTYFDKQFNNVDNEIADQGYEFLKIEQYYMQNKFRKQIWKLSFTNEDEDYTGEYKGRKIEGLFVMPNEFPDKAPKFYFGFFHDKQKIIHENIYGDGLLCIPLLTHNWVSDNKILDTLISIRDIFYSPNLADPANPIFAKTPEIEKKRRRETQAKQLEMWS